MCVFIFVCVYIYMLVYVGVWVYVCVCVYVCICVCMNVSVMYVGVYVYVGVNRCMHVYGYVYVYQVSVHHCQLHCLYKKSLPVPLSVLLKVFALTFLLLLTIVCLFCPFVICSTLASSSSFSL